MHSADFSELCQSRTLQSVSSIAVSGEAFQGVTPSFHLSKNQLGKTLFPRRFYLLSGYCPIEVCATTCRCTFFDIEITYSDDNTAYQKITESKVITGKRNTQRIENKHLSLRTWCSRLVRKGIRFSKSHLMHKIVVGLVINFWFFNCKLW